ncbi:hypothetical protein AAE02nite_23840 [Adhaeribacter aerolatus]|uniref:Uncharacterized protein n=1 Tax=Adhaeribacter aerolatus TaxID=670289 RepID=A0A512AYE9_9BACT|nr:hypothetical protein [Adhaeribacter aerolatus]GEO04720.1 hypothetical protein AAE02nite_23840 [Adhaeribacter aerolatus]
MNKFENLTPALTEVEEIRKLRQQLAEFNPAEGSLEVIFKLTDGKNVRVPITSKVKMRLISKEIRNYLAEEQLLRQCQED